MSIDLLAKRYGCLPSEILVRATTFDLVIMDVAMSYENHRQKTQDPNYVPDYAVDHLIKLKNGDL